MPWAIPCTCDSPAVAAADARRRRHQKSPPLTPACLPPLAGTSRSRRTLQAATSSASLDAAASRDAGARDWLQLLLLPGGWLAVLIALGLGATIGSSIAWQLTTNSW